MIRVRPSAERGHADHGWLDARHSFSFARYYDPKNMGFRALRVLNEDRIRAGSGFGEHPHDNMEIVTYVIDGALSHRDSTGSSGTLARGDVQAMSAGTGVHHSEFNDSPTDTHLIQIWLLPAEQDQPPRYDQTRFDDDQKRNRLQAIASPDGRDGSLPIGRDSTIYASLLSKGESVEHAFGEARYGWIQVIDGELAVDGETLRPGDGAAIEGVASVTLRAAEDAEFLLFDLD